MASLVLILPELLQPEDSNPVIGNSIPISTTSWVSSNAKRVSKKQVKKLPETGDGEFAEDFSEMKVSADLIWP